MSNDVFIGNHRTYFLTVMAVMWQLRKLKEMHPECLVELLKKCRNSKYQFSSDSLLIIHDHLLITWKGESGGTLGENEEENGQWIIIPDYHAIISAALKENPDKTVSVQEPAVTSV